MKKTIGIIRCFGWITLFVLALASSINPVGIFAAEDTGMGIAVVSPQADTGINTSGNVLERTTDAEGLIIKVMTVNLHNGRDLEGKDNLQDFLALLNREKPDLVALQEVERRHLAALRSTGWNVTPGFNANRPDFRFGNVIITPHRLVYQRHHYLPGDLEQRGINEVAVEIDGQYFTVFNTHLGLGRMERESQLGEILRIAAERDGPILLTGDFNTGPQDRLFQMLPEGFFEAGNVYNLPNTFPISNPRFRIDMIWASSDWVLEDAQVLPWKGSDHFPVTAVLRLKEPWRVRPAPAKLQDFDLQYNPLLPDIGINRGGVEFSLEVQRKRVDTPHARLTLPIWSSLTLGGVFADSQPVQFVLAYDFMKVDFRDYFSLYGLRGKGEFTLFAEAMTGEKTSWGLMQYYRWSNRLGTRLTTGFSPDHFFWSIENLYLPTERFSWKLNLNRRGDFSTGIAYQLSKQVKIDCDYFPKDGKVLLGLGFYN